MSKRLKVPKSVNGFGYVGTWSAPKDTLGWMCSPFVSGPYDRRDPSMIAPERYPEVKGTRLFLCEIIIRPVLNKKGSPITKLVKE